MNKITIEGMLKESFELGLKNISQIVVNYLLWILTIWIPYLNIGTTIGIITLPTKIAKGEPINFTEIFDPKYRKYMGEIFLAMSFTGAGIAIGSMLFVLPGIIISIAWSLTLLLVADKNYDPIAAIKKSNDVTYGNKAVIFFGQLIVAIVLLIALAIVSWIISLLNVMILSALVSLAGIVAFGSIMMGITAYIYKTLILTE